MTTVENTQYGLSYEEFCELAKRQKIVSNWTELLADLDTPVAIYAKLRERSRDAFLFESVEGGEKIGRYSLIGYKALKIIQSAIGDCYKQLQDELELYKEDLNSIENKNLPFFHKGFVGYFSFESIQRIEPSLKLHSGLYPEMYLLFVGSLVVFDHVKRKIYVITNTLIDYDGYPSTLDQIKDSNELSDSNKLKGLYDTSLKEIEEIKHLIFQESKLERLYIDHSVKDTHKFVSNTGKENFMSMVETAKEYIRQGDTFQVVLSHKMSAAISVDPLKAYRVLRMVNPSPYMFLFNISLGNNHAVLVGSSPEMLVKCTRTNTCRTPALGFRRGICERGTGVYLSVNEDPERANNEVSSQVSKSCDYWAEIRPIAGTYARGANEAEDEANIKKLLNDEKEKAEHVMLVDLARNDLGRVCESGTIKVAQSMIVEKYSHVLHIVSSVIGKLKAGSITAGLDLLKACFPAGTLSGAPKVEAINIISRLETEPRGPYGGCVGYFSLDGTVDTAILIRTLLIENNKIHIQTGAGIVADSDSEKEYQETMNKAEALIKVVDLCNS